MLNKDPAGRRSRSSSAANERPAPKLRPFLKWVGGKNRVLPQLKPLLPPRIGRYHEPFVGGGAMFFSLQPREAHLWDINAELINCYEVTRDRVEDLIVALRLHRYEKDYYYALRAMDPGNMDPVQRAARTICLNRTGFNGLYRVNRSGTFNVPFGRYTNPTICDAANLRLASKALARTHVASRDFCALEDSVRTGDFVYFDPPYVPRNATSGFTDYSPGGFSWQDQERLAEVFENLARRGANVMLSNSDVPLVRELYADFSIDTVMATRNINSRADRRGAVSEVVVRNYGR
jgi:DNA adenine methylase